MPCTLEELQNLLEYASVRDVAGASMLPGRVFYEGAQPQTAQASGDPKSVNSIIDLRIEDDQAEASLPELLATLGPVQPVCLSAPLSCVCDGGGAGPAHLGLLLRALLMSEPPVLLHGGSWGEAAAVAAVLRLIAGAADAHQTWARLNALGQLRLLPVVLQSPPEIGAGKAVGAEVWSAHFLYSCGLKPTELQELRALLTDEPQPELPSVSFSFLEGSPPQQCRPFQSSEASLLLHSLTRGCLNRAAPTSVVVAALPGCVETGKMAGVFQKLGFEIPGAVRLDIDCVRKFNARFQHYAHHLLAPDAQCQPTGTVTPPVQLQSYEDLVHWFDEGASWENILCKDAASVLQTALKQRFDLVLYMCDMPDCEQLLERIISEGYRVHVVGFDTPADVVVERARVQAEATGILASADYITKCENGLLARFRNLVPRVLDAKGQVLLYDSSEVSSTGLRLLYDSGHLAEGATANDLSVCERWGFAPQPMSSLFAEGGA